MNWKEFLPSFNKENMLQHHYSIKSSLLKVKYLEWRNPSQFSEGWQQFKEYI